VKDCLNNEEEGKDDVIEFELDMLPPNKARSLKEYMEKCIKDNDKKRKRKEADAKRRLKKKEEESRFKQDQ
jgi:hypothetical protein